METSRGLSISPCYSVRRLLLLLLGVALLSRAANAYVSSTSRTIPYNRETSTIPNEIGRGSGAVDFSSRQRSLRLYSNDPSTQDDSESSGKAEDGLSSVTSALSNVTEAKFGEVTPMRQGASVSSAKFGDVVSISSKPSSSPSLFADETPSSSKSSGLSDIEMIKQRKIRNIGVAIVSIALALGNYAYQWTHPVTPIQLLVNMERTSTPLSEIGKNHKPTVIDFWAPW